MKKICFIVIVSFLAIVNVGFSQIHINSTGKVGVNNTSPGLQLDVTGNFRVSQTYQLIYQNGMLYSNSWYSKLGDASYLWGSLHVNSAYVYYDFVNYSDKKLKTDIRSIENSTEKLMKLKPVQYKFIPQFTGDVKADSILDIQSRVNKLGFLAQDIIEIYPELVVEDENGTLGIKYIELIPLLIKGFQEQQKEIETLKEKVSSLKNQKK